MLEKMSLFSLPSCPLPMETKETLIVRVHSIVRTHSFQHPSPAHNHRNGRLGDQVRTGGPVVL